jgi:hypothetical protein
MGELQIDWTPTRAGIPLEARRPELWLSEAMMTFGESPELLEALGEHIGGEQEEELSWAEE